MALPTTERLVWHCGEHTAKPDSASWRRSPMTADLLCSAARVKPRLIKRSSAPKPSKTAKRMPPSGRHDALRRAAIAPRAPTLLVVPHHADGWPKVHHLPRYTESAPAAPAPAPRECADARAMWEGGGGGSWKEGAAAGAEPCSGRTMRQSGLLMPSPKAVVATTTCRAAPLLAPPPSRASARASHPSPPYPATCSTVWLTVRDHTASGRD